MKKYKILAIIILIIIVVFSVLIYFKNKDKNTNNIILENTFFYSHCNHSDCIPINHDTKIYKDIENATIYYLENKKLSLFEKFDDNNQNYTCSVSITGIDKFFIYGWDACSSYVVDENGHPKEDSGYGFGMQKFNYEYKNGNLIVTGLAYPKKNHDILEWKLGDDNVRNRLERENIENFGEFYQLLKETNKFYDYSEKLEEQKRRGFEKVIENRKYYSSLFYKVMNNIYFKIKYFNR